MTFLSPILALILITIPSLSHAVLMAGQDWTGRYRCAQGDTPLTVQIREIGNEVGGSALLSATFIFGGRGKPQGAFIMNGRYSPRTGTVELVPDRWLRRPPGYTAVGMAGQISSDGTRFTGRVDGPLCGDFALTLIKSAETVSRTDASSRNEHGNAPRTTGSSLVVASGVPGGQLPSRRLVSLGTQLGEESAAILDRLPPPKVDPADLSKICSNTGWKFADHDADYDWQKYAGIHISYSNRLFHWAKAHLPLARFFRQAQGRGDSGCLDGQFVARAWQSTFGLPATGVLTAKDAQPLAQVIDRVKRGESEASAAPSPSSTRQESAGRSPVVRQNPASAPSGLTNEDLWEGQQKLNQELERIRQEQFEQERQRQREFEEAERQREQSRKIMEQDDAWRRGQSY